VTRYSAGAAWHGGTLTLSDFSGEVMRHPRTLGVVLAICLLFPLAALAAELPFPRQAWQQDDRDQGSYDTLPVSESCDSKYDPSEYNARIDCKTENVNDALFNYIDAVLDFDGARKSMGREPIFTDSQMDQLLAGRERAQSAKNRSNDAKAFRGQVKKQKAEDEDCYTKERIGDNKGDDIQPCVSGEDCEEVIGDGIGNDDGKCKLQGNNREVCVQVCQQPLLTEPETYDSGQAADTENGLEELEVALIDATVETKKAMDLMAQKYAAAPGTTNECAQFQFDLAPTAIALQVAQVAKNASGAAFNGCSVVCNQDAFGWNCEAGCLALAIIDGVVNGINDALTIADGSNGSAQLDQVARCSQQLETQIEGVQSGVDSNGAALDGLEEQLTDLQEQIATLTDLMNQRFDVVEGLLCVPQGQRECFPDGLPASSVPRGR